MRHRSDLSDWRNSLARNRLAQPWLAGPPTLKASFHRSRGRNAVQRSAVTATCQRLFDKLVHEILHRPRLSTSCPATP